MLSYDVNRTLFCVGVDYETRDSSKLESPSERASVYFYQVTDFQLIASTSSISEIFTMAVLDQSTST